jgi:hypothetical protein
MIFFFDMLGTVLSALHVLPYCYKLGEGTIFSHLTKEETDSERFLRGFCLAQTHTEPGCKFTTA